MKLFHRSSQVKGDAEPAPISPSPSLPPPPQKISLSAEQKAILEEPINPRVDQILQSLYADKAAAEGALRSRGIIAFPSSDLGERHVVQDNNGFWRIIPGPAPLMRIDLSDAL